MKAIWPVSLSCEVLGVSVSGYFEHQRRQQWRRPSQPGSGRLSDEAATVTLLPLTPRGPTAGLGRDLRFADAPVS
jgi:hypothetical protein